MTGSFCLLSLAKQLTIHFLLKLVLNLQRWFLANPLSPHSLSLKNLHPQITLSKMMLNI